MFVEKAGTFGEPIGFRDEKSTKLYLYMFLS
jgi:hypothetical protein